jgi:hypothetical protein
LQRYFRGDCVLPTPAIAREIRSPICNEGRKAHRIATFFNRNPEKYPTATSGRSWTETTIKRILKREGIGLPQIVP